jgi:hypothetical protein
MAHRIVHPSIEQRDIHLAVCRARRAELVCSTCSELAERATRAASSVIESEAA